MLEREKSTDEYAVEGGVVPSQEEAGGAAVGDDRGSAVEDDVGAAVGGDRGAAVGDDGGAAVGDDGGAAVGDDAGAAVEDDGGAAVGDDGGAAVEVDRGAAVGQHVEDDGKEGEEPDFVGLRLDKIGNIPDYHFSSGATLVNLIGK